MRTSKLLLPLLSLMLMVWHPLHAQAVLNANPGPSNNGGLVGSAILFDVEAATGVVLTGLTTATVATPGEPFTVNVYTRDGSALGGPVDSGPGSSPAGWTLRGSVTGTRESNEISLPIALPDLAVGAGRTLGIALQFVDSAPSYFGTGTPAIETYSNAAITLRTGDARSVPFTATGSFFSSRALVGSLRYRLADPVLDANPGPSNNSGAANSGLFFNLQTSRGAVVTGMQISNTAGPGAGFQIEVHTRAGTALGNITGSGPATSTAGWTLLGTVDAVQGAGELSMPITLPPIIVPAGQTVGVGLVFRGAGPRYFGTGDPPLETYTAADLTLVTGQAMTVPFTPSSSVFSSRALVGSLSWHPLRETLPASEGPSNNGGDTGSGIFLDLIASTPLRVNAMRFATSALPGTTQQVRMFTRSGSALGSSASSGPSSSNAGWTLHETLQVVQGATGNVSLPVGFSDLALAPGETIGIGLVFDDASPSYRGTGAPPLGVYSDDGLTLVTGEARQTPFAPTGNFFVSREMVGTIYFRADRVFSNGFE